jgi:hypothetical protein
LTVRNARLLGIAGLGAALSLGGALPARAQPAPPEPTDEQRAVVLFEQARLFVKNGNHCDLAIPIFQASLALHPTVGSQLNIADCYEKTNRTYSAWKAFNEAAGMAQGAHDEREALARARAAALEPKIPKLEVDVPPECNLPGYELRVDGDLLGNADWGKARPMDPGSHLLEANAPGKRRWTGGVTLDPSGEVQRIVVPVLPDETTIVRVLPSAVPGQRQRVIGASLILSGAAVAAVPGTIVTLYNHSQDNRNWVGAVIFGLGGVSLVTGAVVFFTAPRPTETGLRVAPLVGDRSAGLSVGGAW